MVQTTKPLFGLTDVGVLVPTVFRGTVNLTGSGLLTNEWGLPSNSGLTACSYTLLACTAQIVGFVGANSSAEHVDITSHMSAAFLFAACVIFAEPTQHHHTPKLKMVDFGGLATFLGTAVYSIEGNTLMWCAAPTVRTLFISQASIW